MNNRSIQISVVIPLYKNENFITEMVSRLKNSLVKISPDFEIILVNDGSPDKSWSLIKDQVAADPRITGIAFPRNFGQHVAITAGLDHCSGKWVVVMDGDLQDKPEEILKLYQKAMEGFEAVLAKRRLRKDGFFKKLASKIFYRLFDFFVEGKTDNTIANFGIYSRKVIDNFLKMRELNRFFPTFITWLGFKTSTLEVEHDSRRVGKSAYTLSKKVNLAIDVIVAMSNKPLKLTIKFGFLVSLTSTLISVYLVLKYLLWGIPVEGWTSLMVSLFLVAGFLFTIAGILGLYLGKIFDEVKKRPLYIIEEIAKSNVDQK